MSAALEAFRAGDWPRALPGLRALHARSPSPALSSLLGITLFNLGDHAGAATLFEVALAADPGSRDARFHLGRIALIQGDAAGAARHMERILQARPDDALALLFLARSVSTAGDVPAALRCWQALSERFPREPEPWLGLANGLALVGQHEAAIRAAEQAVQVAPDEPAARARLGALLVEQGRLDVAEPHLRAAGAEPDAVGALASILLRRGALEEARGVLGQLAVEQMPAHVVEVWADVLARGGDAEAARRKTDIMLDGVLEREDRVVLLHARATLNDRLGRVADAFRDWAAANQLRPATYSPQQNRAETDAIIAAYPRVPPARSAEPTPPVVLIVGMPRSGSSLLEQMLDAHPGLVGAGELRALHDATQLLPGYPATAQRLSPQQLAAGTRAYAQAVRAVDAGQGRVVIDKMPHNFRNLGAAVQLLPGVRVLHCVRDPVDTCFSCFRQRFRDGMSYTTRLDWLASFYRDYARLMAHWRAVLPAGTLLDVSYSELVRCPEQTIGGVLSFLGQPYDAGCVRPDLNRRGVRTASRVEVTRPIHTRSLGRSVPYRDLLVPLVSALEGTR